MASNQTQYDTRKHAQTESYQANRRFELVVVHLSTSALEHPRVSHLTYRSIFLLVLFPRAKPDPADTGWISIFLSKKGIDVEYRNVEIIRRVLLRRVLKHLVRVQQLFLRRETI